MSGKLTHVVKTAPLQVVLVVNAVPCLLATPDVFWRDVSARGVVDGLAAPQSSRRGSSPTVIAMLQCETASKRLERRCVYWISSSRHEWAHIRSALCASDAGAAGTRRARTVGSLRTRYPRHASSLSSIFPTRDPGHVTAALGHVTATPGGVTSQQLLVTSHKLRDHVPLSSDCHHTTPMNTKTTRSVEHPSSAQAGNPASRSESRAYSLHVHRTGLGSKRGRLRSGFVFEAGRSLSMSMTRTPEERA
eukprot:3921077-Rhodomonas_salina.1